VVKDFNQLRRQVGLWLLPLGAIASILGWFVSLERGPAAFLDLVALPLLALSLLLLELLLLFKRISFKYVEIGTLLALSIYQLSLMVNTVFTGHETQVGSSALWFPLVFLLAFLFLSRPRALKFSLLYYGLSLTTGLLGLGLGSLGRQGINTLLQFYLANLSILVILNLYAYWRERHDVVDQMAHTDALTRLPNRRWMQGLLDQAFSRVGSREPFAVLLIDLDHFKKINDQYGHAIGDEILYEVGVRLNSVLRRSDALARWGGEEFLVLAQNSDLAQAQQLASRLGAVVREQPFAASIKVTLSVGVTCYKTGDTASDLVHRADTALYKAKSHGRDRLESLSGTEAGI
jgi:diguanylate cyclase (GGDEF)-like protein